MYARAFIAPLVTLAVMVGVFFGGLHIGKELEQGKHAQDRAELLLQAYNQYQESINKERELSRKTIEGLENERNQIRIKSDQLAAAGRLRIPATVCDPVPKGGASSGPDEAIARTIELPEAIDSSLRAITRDADEVTAQCRALQSWVWGQYGQ